MAIAVVADSSACQPAEVAVQQSIILVPLAIVVDGEQVPDGDTRARDFYERLKLAHEVSTAAPAPGAFLEAIRHGQESGAGGVLCLTLSSEYSGTYSASMTAREIAASKWPDF